MNEFAREAAVERVERLLDTVESEPMPVPVREVWVYGDVALGLDPVERLDVYLTKDILLGADDERGAELSAEYGVDGIGSTVRADWAERHPEYVRANDNGHAAPEQCLAAHLVEDDEPIHLEVCNASFEDNVTRRLEGAMARGNYHQILDPRGVCLWIDVPASEASGGSVGGEPSTGGQRSEDAMAKLRNAELPFPKLSEAIAMLGVDDEEAQEAARAVHDYRSEQEGATVRGDVV
jgi:hypothetical protein